MKKKVTIFIFIVLSNLLIAEQVILTLFTTEGQDTQYVDNEVKELHYSKNPKLMITYIEGLNQLTHLETITFNMVSSIEDYSFIQEAINLKKIIISFTHATDWTFIESLPYLEILCIQYLDKKELKLNLVNNNRLVYLEIRNSNLETFPDLFNIPSTLQYINLAGNKIRQLPENFLYQENIKIFFKFNPLENTNYKNVILEWPEEILPQEYIIPY
jgi:Leucine-rich repeat (LRR) protein